MENEKLLTVFDFFRKLGIEIPVQVNNVIEDVFKENDVIDTVNCYFLEDVDTFEKDMTIKNTSYIDLKTGAGKGTNVSTWTYYGNILYSLSEDFRILDINDSEFILSDLKDDNYSTLEDPNDWCIIVTENLQWDSTSGSDADKVVRKNVILSIYCPQYDEEASQENLEDNK